MPPSESEPKSELTKSTHGCGAKEEIEITWINWRRTTSRGSWAGAISECKGITLGLSASFEDGHGRANGEQVETAEKAN